MWYAWNENVNWDLLRCWCWWYRWYQLWREESESDTSKMMMCTLPEDDLPSSCNTACGSLGVPFVFTLSAILMSEAGWRSEVEGQKKGKWDCNMEMGSDHVAIRLRRLVSTSRATLTGGRMCWQYNTITWNKETLVGGKIPQHLNQLVEPSYYM